LWCEIVSPPPLIFSYLTYFSMVVPSRRFLVYISVWYSHFLFSSFFLMFFFLFVQTKFLEIHLKTREELILLYRPFGWVSSIWSTESFCEGSPDGRRVSSPVLLGRQLFFLAVLLQSCLDLFCIFSFSDFFFSRGPRDGCSTVRFSLFLCRAFSSILATFQRFFSDVGMLGK